MVYGLILLAGLAFGSFVNAAVWRLQQRSAVSGQRSARKGHSKKLSANSYPLTANDLSIVKGRSICTRCGHRLAWYDLIPVVSWLMLRGRCRYCHQPISLQYPLVEILTAGLFALSYAVWPHGFDTAGIVLLVGWMVMLTGLVALAVYDLKWMLLPDKIVFPLLGFWAVVIVAEAIIQTDFGLVTRALFGVLAIGGTFWLLFQISKGRWIGGGDVKLGFALGLVAGSLPRGLMVIFVASVLGTAVSLPFLIMGKLRKTSRIPFGPFLIAASIFVFLFGNSIITWLETNYLYL